eukprot:TRINITY_DN1390_c0_g1_i3.p1 TRINITY_DN1390_c0_g1~~TRINITY_DN1390_c0_g1_i3.p1  ORF type:complete len:1112 (-),score=337.00 TRINITY_DN1390_c0_g1_i3:220-3555(-)
MSTDASSSSREPQAILQDMGVNASFDNLLSFSFGDLQTILGAILTKLDQHGSALGQGTPGAPSLASRLQALEDADLASAGERLKLIEDKIQDAEWAKGATGSDGASEGISTKIRHVEEELSKQIRDLESSLNGRVSTLEVDLRMLKESQPSRPPTAAASVARTPTPRAAGTPPPIANPEALGDLEDKVRVLEKQVNDLQAELASVAEKNDAKADLQIEGDKADFETLEKYTKRFCSILEKDVRKNRESISEVASEMGALNSQQELKHNHSVGVADKLRTEVNDLTAWRSDIDAMLDKLKSETEALEKDGKQAQQELQELKTRVDQLPADLENLAPAPKSTLPSSSLFVLGKDGAVERWGDSGHAITGLNNPVGSNVYDSKLIPMTARGKVQPVLDAVFAGNATVTETIPLHSANGGTIDVKVDFRPIMDIAMVKVLSVEVKQAAYPTERILAADKSGIVTQWSDFAKQLTGVPTEQALGQMLAEFLDPDTKLDADNIFHRAQGGKLTLDHHFSFLDSHGIVSTVTACCHPNRVANKIEGLTLVGGRCNVTIERTGKGHGTAGVADDIELFSLSPDGKIRDWNAQSVALTGINVDDVVGKSLVEDLLDEQSKDEVKEFLFPSVEREEENSPELLAELYLMVGKDGDKVPLNVAMSLDRDATGKIVSIVARFVNEHLIRLHKDIRRVQKDIRGAIGAEMDNFVTHEELQSKLDNYQPAGDETVDQDIAANRAQIASLQERISALASAPTPARNSSFKSLDLGAISDGDAHGVKKALSLLEARQLDLESMLEQKAARQQAENLKRTIDDLFSSLLQLKARVDDAFGKTDKSEEQQRILSLVNEQLEPIEQRLTEQEGITAGLTKDKASWSELNLILEDKANASDLGTKANRSYAEALFERINNALHTELARLKSDESAKGLAGDVERLQQILEGKADINEVNELRHDVHIALERAQNVPEDTAAGANRALVHNYRCLSCDKFLPVLVSKPTFSSHSSNMPPGDPDSLAPKIHFHRHKFHQTPPTTPTSNLEASARSPRAGRGARTARDFDGSPPRHRPHTVYATPASGLSQPPRTAPAPHAGGGGLGDSGRDASPAKRAPIQPPPDPYKQIQHD